MDLGDNASNCGFEVDKVLCWFGFLLFLGLLRYNSKNGVQTKWLGFCDQGVDFTSCFRLALLQGATRLPKIFKLRIFFYVLINANAALPLNGDERHLTSSYCGGI